MTIRLTDAERSRLWSMAKRPRSRKQGYRARALLALDEGHPVETVARMFRVGVERVESWISGFQARRLGSLDEPPGFRARVRREADSGRGFDEEED